MVLSAEEVRRVARLARLHLSPEEVERFRVQLSQVLEAAEGLRELDTDGVEPTAHAIPVSNVFRDDERRPSLPRELVLMNAPESVDGLFKVPRIVELEE